MPLASLVTFLWVFFRRRKLIQYTFYTLIWFRCFATDASRVLWMADVFGRGALAHYLYIKCY